MRKSCSEAVDQRHDIVAVWNRQFPAWTEVILHIHNQQNIALADCDLLNHAPDLS
jgi:hypothetical protein